MRGKRNEMLSYIMLNYNVNVKLSYKLTIIDTLS